jgi:hypothetical protein
VQINLTAVEFGSELDLDDLDAGQSQNILSVCGGQDLEAMFFITYIKDILPKLVRDDFHTRSNRIRMSNRLGRIKGRNSLL